MRKSASVLIVGEVHASDFGELRQLTISVGATMSRMALVWEDMTWRKPCRTGRRSHLDESDVRQRLPGSRIRRRSSAGRMSFNDIPWYRYKEQLANIVLHHRSDDLGVRWLFRSAPCCCSRSGVACSHRMTSLSLICLPCFNCPVRIGADLPIEGNLVSCLSARSGTVPPNDSSLQIMSEMFYCGKAGPSLPTQIE